MTLTLGDGFRMPEVLPAPLPDPNDLRIELVLEALESLRSSLNLLPAPQVTIDAPDLSAIVNAVNGLRPGVVDPDEIGRAVANALIPMRPDAANTDWQERLVKALEKLDYRMKGIGSGGSGFIPDIQDRAARQLGIVSVTGPVSSAAAVNGTASGTLTAVGQAVAITVPDSHSSWSVTLGGTFSATSQVAFEFSEDNTTWFAANGRRNLDVNTNDTTNLLDVNPVGGPAPTGANPSHWRGNAGGIRYFRVRCAQYAAADAIAVTIVTSAGVGTTFLNSPTPPVANYAASGTLTNLNDAVTIAALGMSGYSAVITGTWTGTLTLEATVDGVTWNPINGAVQGVGTLSSTITTNTQVRGTLGGLKQFRVRLSAVGSGTAQVSITAGAGTAGVFMMAPVSIAALTGVVSNRQNVSTTAARVDAGFSRTSVEIKALAANTGPVYVGFTNAVTVASGREVSPGEAWSVDIGPTIGVYAVAGSAQAVQVTEVG